MTFRNGHNSGQWQVGTSLSKKPLALKMSTLKKAVAAKELKSETFADQPNRGIEAFRNFRGRRKNEGKFFFSIRIFSVNLYNSAFLIFIFVTIKSNN